MTAPFRSTPDRLPPNPGRLATRPLLAGLAALGLLAALPACVAPSHHPARRDRTGHDAPAVQATLAAEAEMAAYAEDVRRIVAASLADGRAYDRLAELVQVAPHRLSGSAGYDDAVAWAVDVLRADGRENVRLQPVTVPHWERGSVATLQVRVDDGPSEALRIVALGGSVATPAGGITAPVLEVHDFDELERRAAEVPGSIVFFNRPMDASLPDSFAAYGGAVDQRSRGAAETARLGGLAAVVRSMTTRLDDAPHTGALRYAADGPRVPGVAVSTLGAERLSQLIASNDEVRLHLELDSAWHDDAPAANVIGELVGRERPDEILVVGGHLDAWDVGQGAHDDGAGCVQAMEALRLLDSLGLRPRRTLRVVLFANEENGLAGGRAYRDGHADELGRHVLAIESDRGGFTPRGFDTDANPEARAILEAAAALLAEAGADRVVDGRGGADIGPLRDDGVIVVGFRPDPQRYFDLHHSENDTLDQVSPRELNLGAGVIAALLYVVAEREETLPRNPASR